MTVRKHALAELRRCSKAGNDLFLPFGSPAFAKGDVITVEALDLLAEEGVEYLCDVPEHQRKEFALKITQIKVSLDAPILQRDGQLQKNLFDANGTLRFKAGDIWKKTLSETLRSEGIRDLWYSKDASEIARQQSLLAKLASLNTLQATVTVTSIAKSWPTTEGLDFSEVGLEQLSQEIDANIMPDGTLPLHLRLVVLNPLTARNPESRLKVTSQIQSAVRKLRDISGSLALGHDMPADGLHDLCSSMVNLMVEDGPLLLASLSLPNTDTLNGFVTHQNVNRAILSVSVACTLGYSEAQVREISYGALLHDIGMLMVPRSLVEKRTPLDDQERLEILKHPIHSLDMLSRLKGIPRCTPLIAYQCHERGDGSGYPRRKKSHTLFRYSKIVMLCDVYCAMTSPRPFRKATLPHDVIQHLYAETRRGRFDRGIFQALLQTLGTWPIGSWVALSDGAVGKVIGVHPQNPDHPMVRVIHRMGTRLREHVVADLSVQGAPTVLKAVDGSKLGFDALEGF